MSDPTVDDLLARADNDLRLLKLGGYEHTADLVAGLAAALRAQAAETAKSQRQANQYAEELQREHVRIESLRAELAEARAAAPRPLWTGTTKPRKGFSESSFIERQIDVPPGTEVTLYRADQTPPGIRGWEIAEAIYNTETARNFNLTPAAARFLADHVVALIHGEGNQ